MPETAALQARIRFDRRAADANGDPVGPWVDGFTIWAQLVFLRGSEQALSNRVEGRQPVMIDVRETELTRQIDNGMRAVVIRARGVRGGTELNITASAPGKDPGFINVIATAGGAVG